VRAIDIIPPTYFYVFLLAMVLLHFVFPVAQVLGFPWRLLGIIPVVVGATLAIMADRAFKQVGTTVKPLEDSTTLVTTGMFGVSRHPMYLGFVVFLLGTAMLLGSLTPFLVAIAFAVLMEVVFVRFEERKMEKQFGEAWLDYKRRVRRWL
jgi:protein-S-isoprenylcysteine O-methyltransferase Ste14